MQDSPLDLPLELWRHIYTFLDSSGDRPIFERVNLLFRSLCLEEEKREIRELFQLHNKYLFHPLHEDPVPEEKIKQVEEKIGKKIPFHLREFIKLSDGRIRSVTRPAMPTIVALSPHWSNCLYCFDNWYLNGKWLIISTSHKQKTDFKVDLENGKVQGQYQTSISVKEWLKLSFDCSGTINPFDNEKLCHISNRNDLKSILRDSGYLFDVLPKNLRNDKEIVKCAIVSSSLPFRLTSTAIAEDPEVVKRYFEHGNTDFRFLSEKFRKDKNLILKYSTEWDDVDESLHNDKDVLMHYFKTSKYNRVPIPNMSEDMIIEAAKHGKECDIRDCFSNELVLKILDYSIPKDGNLLAYFIKENENLLEERVLKRISELNPIFVLLNLNYDDITLTKEQVLKYINEIEGSFENVPRKWREDRDVARAALVKSYHNYGDIGSKLAKDIDFLTPIVENYAIPLSMPNTLLEQFKNDKDMIRKVLNKNHLLLPYYPYKLDKEFLDTLDFKYSNGRLYEILQRSSYEHYCELYESIFKE